MFLRQSYTRVRSFSCLKKKNETNNYCFKEEGKGIAKERKKFEIDQPELMKLHHLEVLDLVYFQANVYFC